MGGTDRQDQNINRHCIAFQGKKWYWCIFTWLIDVTKQNVWLLHKKCGGELTQFEFKKQITQTYQLGLVQHLRELGEQHHTQQKVKNEC